MTFVADQLVGTGAIDQFTTEPIYERQSQTLRVTISIHGILSQPVVYSRLICWDKEGQRV